MEVLLLISLVCFAAAELTHDFAHSDTFVRQRRFILKKRFRPKFHISAPVGWLNSPAGFTYFKHRYHVFYQYHPFNGAWGNMHWGLATSENLVDWVHYPPAILPKDFYDRHGCIAGSTIIHNNYLTIFYTGHVTSNNKTIQTQNLAISADGITFQKYLYNPIIRHPPMNTSELRNPKVWRFRNKWYMLLGSGSVDRHGQLVLYTSPDMFHWKYNCTIAKSYGDMGYMWENPDFFEIDGQNVLILSVQGIQADSHRFRNLYQTGYVIGNFDYQSLRFEELEVSLSTFTELDFGHDFYAAQTMLALDGRRLLVAWLGMWESDFEESKDGWASMLTIIRELRINSVSGHLLMNPVREITELRTEVLEDAWYSPGEAFHAGCKTFELIVNANTALYDAGLIFEWNGERQFSISYNAERGRITIDRGGIDGARRADWAPDKIYWRIFVDASSIELFCGSGEVVFSSRVYPKRSIRVHVGGEMQLHVTQYKLRRSMVYDNKLHQYMKNNFFDKVMF